MPENSTKEIIDYMLKEFKPERYAYLSVTIASFLLLLTCVILYLTKQEITEKNLAPIFGMIGSGGAIAYTGSQLLRMWNDCMSLFKKSLDNEDEHG